MECNCNMPEQLAILKYPPINLFLDPGGKKGTLIGLTNNSHNDLYFGQHQIRLEVC